MTMWSKLTKQEQEAVIEAERRAISREVWSEILREVLSQLDEELIRVSELSVVDLMRLPAEKMGNQR